ncbi:MAG: DNA gyrase/topoisomerase IV subunit A [Bacteroidetes bacterium]|nr:DNA gyrase/topoisomerase IV subunit A [Bacteroidota bacterium]MDA1120745.1 DNA gyrase/topoisomerase IV subunit A [Bacteroidota bacterium]
MAEDSNGHKDPKEKYQDEAVIHDVIPVSGMYENWFLDYASYVILERAVPAIEDGFKPVQRRIMHAMKEMDDGRFNKVANIIGSTMQYHPHGDASIGDAIVNMGQKDLLIDTQGNWGDVRTGDRAAASRYVEARLSKFALEVVFNQQTTNWQLSYDGRKKEPETLPVKFPLLLAQGVEGIAVGLSTKILPHNFRELIDASIKLLKGKRPKIFPDFLTGGMMDISDYNDGERGGRITIRSKIEEFDKKTLLIKEIPFGTTTTSLIESIVKANEKGKIKIRKVVDNTAKDVEIEIQLAPGQSPDIAIDALYAFTDCEVSVSPNACVIIKDTPHFLTVSEILRVSTEQTVDLLQRELEIRKGELLEKILFSSLEKIFIENRIYRDIEECETWQAVIDTIDKGLDPFKSQFYRKITEEDIVRLTEIKIKRISRFDAFKADELMKRLEEELKETEHHLANIVDYAISYFENLLTKYGKGRERKTEIATFDTITASVVAANNARLYVNMSDGFIGYGLKKDEFVCDCSDMDDIIVFRQDGKCVVTKIGEKVFVGKNILQNGVHVFKKSDERMVYNMAYVDGKSGKTFVKRFQVMAVTRDKEYDLTKGHNNSKVLYFSANPNGEAEVITINLTSGSKARKKVLDFDFSELEIKGRGAGGNTLTKYPIRKIVLKEAGKSTLGGLEIWYDDSIGRLNRDGRGTYTGNFRNDDLILVIYRDGSYELTSFELTNRYEFDRIVFIRKFNPKKPVSVVYYDGESKTDYIKRFQIETTTINKRFAFVAESRSSRIHFANTGDNLQVDVAFKKSGIKETTSMDLSELIDVKGWKSIGNKFPIQKPISIKSTQVDIEPIASNIDGIGVEEDMDNITKQSILSEDIDKSKQKPAIITEKKEDQKGASESFDVGSTIDLDIKQDKDDQLDLF